MTDDPIKAAIDDIAKLSPDEVNLVVTASEDGDKGGGVEAKADIGKPGGWTLGGSARWLTKSGWRVVGALNWKKDA
jgi:hypothetical protein